MDDHLGYESYERSDNENYRNGTKSKKVRSKYGEFEIDVPQDRDSTFEPKIVRKRQKDTSEIDDKIISMYAHGLTTRQISEQIEDIYGFECSEGFISDTPGPPAASAAGPHPPGDLPCTGQRQRGKRGCRFHGSTGSSRSA